MALRMQASGKMRGRADFREIVLHACPCGHFGDPFKECRCSTAEIQRYRSRVSGPLLDRIDIHIEVPAVRHRELMEGPVTQSSQEIRSRVARARGLQEERFRAEGIHCNAQMGNRQIRRYCRLTEEGKELLEMAMRRLGLSARAYTRVLKVSRTIADLEGSEEIRPEHLSEAIQYRGLDRAFPY
ncbi:MAG: ATP-binding protein [Deltaproteobacteria bacterium]|nr:MAG: ATP-binding protein [Deltaproteobacteria bacterium]